MLFNSLEYFLLFLPLAVLIYFACSRFATRQAGIIWLVTSSLLFYGYSSTKYISIVLISIVINFFIGKLIIRNNLSAADRPESKYNHAILLLGISINISILAYFKYMNFFIETINTATHASIRLPDIALPLAISFYTFQQISYLADCFKAKINKANIAEYFFFVLFFPQLIAGPILRYAEIIPQLTADNMKRVNWDNIGKGVFLFAAGLFKKVVIADTFARWAIIDAVQNKSIGFVDAWTISLSYTFQLYYDFSGYSDMAIGAALLFNFKLPINFNSPYQAANIQDFWRRWHITLSRWLRDYLYIPLGGNKKGTSRTLLNIFLTFLLGGIWHGAGWTFVAWGALHGAGLAAHRVWQRAGLSLHPVLGRLCTFLFINFTWVYFHAPDMALANSFIKAMLGLTTGQSIGVEFARYYQAWLLLPLAGFTLLTITTMTLFAIAALIAPNTMQVTDFTPYTGRWRFIPDHKFALLLSALIFFSLLTFTGNVSKTDFIYFQF